MSRVVIVGGGLSGISAAVDCALGGASVTLLESRSRLGGAAYSFTRGELRADNGQHVFLRCCSAYRELLGRLGAEQLTTLQDRLSIPVLAPGRAPAYLRRSGLPAPLHLAASLLRYPFLNARQKLSAATTMEALRKVDPDDPAADARSFGDWLTEHGQGPEALETLWELIARPTINLTAADASLAQAAYVFQQGLLGDADAGDVGYARVPLGEIHDVAARRALAEAGVEVRLRAGVTTIDRGEDGFRVSVSGQQRLIADAVVVAVQADRAARVLPRAAGIDPVRLGQLGSSPIVNLHAVFDRHVFDHEFAATVNSPLQWVFDRTAGAGLRAGQYLAVSLSAADAELHMPAGKLLERFMAAFAELLPAVRDAKLQQFFVTREHAATFRAAPGQRALRPGPRTAIAGLALAGAWTDTGWPATMEGAVRSGHAAAEVALRAIADRPQNSAAVAA
jgi:hydroxysqualene dehydroxylase